MTLRATIMNTSSSTISQTFNNTWQYRDARGDGAWIDWVKFEISSLVAQGKADVNYTWVGGVGEWEFRLVADSNGVIAESNEMDNTSEPMKVTIAARAGAPVPEASEGGTATIRSGKPVISGTSAGLGKVRVGSLSFATKMTNIGNGSSRAFKALLQYSKDDANWSNWVQIDLAPLGAGQTSDISYSWNGGEGVWFFRACDGITNTCSASTKVEIVAI
jgi:hypothetical protein